MIFKKTSGIVRKNDQTKSLEHVVNYHHQVAVVKLVRCQYPTEEASARELWCWGLLQVVSCMSHRNRVWIYVDIVICT